LDAGDAEPSYVSSGATVVFSQPIVGTTINAPNIIDGSKYLVFIDSVPTGGLKTVSGGSGISESYVKDTDYTAGQSWDIWIVYTSGTSCKDDLTLSGEFGSSTQTDTRPDSQTDCDVYVALGWDGSSFESIYSIDTANDEVDIDVNPTFDCRQAFSYLKYAQTVSEAQLLDLYGEFGADDIANYFFTGIRRSLRFDNTTALQAKETSGARWYDKVVSDGDPTVNPTSGGGGIKINYYEKVFVSIIGQTSSASGGVGNAVLSIPMTSTGLTITATVYDTLGVIVGSATSLTDRGNGIYSAFFSLASVDDGQYIVLFTDSDSEQVGEGELFVRGGNEVSPEIYFNGTLDTVKISGTKDTLDDLNDVSPTEVWQENIVGAGLPNGSAGQVLENVPPLIATQDSL
jgi:hypothetical protein